MSSSTSHPETTRIDRLLRSLVGVADVHIATTTEGKFRVTVLRDGAAQEHQLVRNVLSGLKAGFGLQLAPDDVHVVLHLDSWPHRALQSAPPAADTLVTAQPAATAGVETPVNGNGKSNGNGNGNTHHGNGNGIGNGNGHYAVKQGNGNGQHTLATNGNGHHASPTNGNGNGAHVAGSNRLTGLVSQATSFDREVARTRVFVESAPPCGDGLVPDLDSIEIERAGTTLRCRVTVRVAEKKYSAIAEARETSGMEAELAARVTLDALRAGGLTTSRLDGVSLTTIGDVVYVVAAVRPAGTSVPRASAAPLLKTLASAAATAVLRAQGPIGI